MEGCRAGTDGEQGDCDKPVNVDAIANKLSDGMLTSPSPTKEVDDAQPAYLHTNSSGIPDIVYPTAASTQGVPDFGDFNYPCPLVVKNTFLDDAPEPGSLEPFLNARKIKSAYPCIGYPHAFEDKEEDDDDQSDNVDSPDSRMQQLASPQNIPLRSPQNIFPPVAVPPLPAPVMQQFGPLPIHPQAMPPGIGVMYDEPMLEPPGLPQPQREATILRLADALPEMEPGTPDMPSSGSNLHRFGTCRPCAHHHSPKGCSNGPQCKFCHLCPPGELKRRQKAKKTAGPGELSPGM